MAYATSADLTDRYGASYLVDIADRDDNDVADTDAVTAALDDGASEIDMILGKKYPVPLTTVPDWVVRGNCDIAAYELASEGRGALTDEIIRKYERLMGDGEKKKGRLQQVADGDISLGLGDDEPDTNFEPEIHQADRVMGVAQTKGLI